ncbi:MAG: AAA family ATPase [Desulfobacterales bacterium]|nr:MAG: AAA family ATPase [Desulfobacterales bacterium]
MKCLNCEFENSSDAKFCNACGHFLGLICPFCQTPNPARSNFCKQCGQPLPKETGPGLGSVEREPPQLDFPARKIPPPYGAPAGERKFVTVLFSDLSGYTALSERLDPEEVKEIMSWIFGAITEIVAKYDGFIEKFVGDAVMALFGAAQAHEDDPIRAIRAAQEIHDLVAKRSAAVQGQIGQPLAMHTGINTGLVVTGEVKFARGTHGVAGAAVNLAARLSSLGQAGDILVGLETYQQARGYFDFEALTPVRVKGKTEPLRVFRVTARAARPKKIHRFHGLRAALIGRKLEIELLAEAVKKLRDGKGSVIAISGNAGTGKSRLVEEFRSSLNLKEVNWREGQCYPHSQNITYFPVIDLLNRGFRIEEGDPPENVRAKIESGLAGVAKTEDVIPYVGRLYNLGYPELEGLSPEIWKIRLQKAILAIVNALAGRAPTIICLEDLHWSDPSSLELIRFLLSDFRYPALILCVFRPTVTLFSSHQIGKFGPAYQEIRLEDLSPSETQDMVASLLGTHRIPSDLRRLLREKAEGNPFYLEELINSLVESEILVRENNLWVLKRSLGEADISATIRGVIAARLDRLDHKLKRILQEAAVIGRAFYSVILTRITDHPLNIEQCLSRLEHLDLIKTRALQPDLEYIFKHALTQEVVYSGLLKTERQALHERVGVVMEELFHDRLPAYYEALAFHFKRGQSLAKAIDYLAKSGAKSLERYALEEAHRYYQDAFELLRRHPPESKPEGRRFIDLLNQWSFVYYYRGRYKELLEILARHQALADSLDDKDTRGMFYAWLGCALWHRECFNEAYQCLSTALQLGEATQNHPVVGYACAWLTWVCTELGLMDEALALAARAQRIWKAGRTDPYIYFNSLAGMGYALWHQGDSEKTREIGHSLLDFGRTQSDDRIMGMGYCCIGWSRLAAGDLSQATASLQQAVKVSVDPWYSLFPKLALAYGLILDGKIQDAQQHIDEILEFSQACGAEFAGKPAYFFHGIVLVTRGQISQGLKILEESYQSWIENGSKLRHTVCGYILANMYAHLAQAAPAAQLENTAAPAEQKAAAYFRHAIECAQEIGARGTLGRAYLSWGFWSRQKGNHEAARRYFTRAIQYFRQCRADVYLKQAQDALASLKS